MLENGQMMTINIRDVLPNRFQPRIHFEENQLNELAESIRKYGLIQPIVVRQIGSKYEIISGERRFKASFLANKETIPAIVVTLTDRECEEIALLENIQRQDLTPIEEAVSFKRILDVGYITQEQLAAKVGKSQSFIANKIRLLNLDDDVQDALLHGQISERHARSLLKIHDKTQQVSMLNRIINERLTVKMTDKAIKDLLSSEDDKNDLDKKEEIKNIAPVKKDDTDIETLVVEKKKKPAVPVGSHRIIKVSPPKDLEEKLKAKERGASFMDIDKIMEEAKDITPNEETKPVNDIADLMKQNPSNVTSPLIESKPAQNDNNELISNPLPNVTPQNRFVSVPIEQQNSNMMTSNDSIPTPAVNFNSIFNQTATQPVGDSLGNNASLSGNFVPSLNQNDDMLNANQNMNNNLPAQNFNNQPEVGPMLVGAQNLMNNNLGSVPLDGVNNAPSMVEPEVGPMPAGAPNLMNNNLGSVPLDGVNNASSMVEPEVGPMPVGAPNLMNNNLGNVPLDGMNNISGPSMVSVDSGMDNFPPLSGLPEQNFNSQPEVGPIPTGTPDLMNNNLGNIPLDGVNNVPSPNLLNENIISDNLNGISSSEKSSPIMNIPDSDIIETSATDNSQINEEPIINNENTGINEAPVVNGVKDFKQVLNLIRNCSSEIEKLGYFVDVDEADMGNSYQVTFRINKE